LIAAAPKRVVAASDVQAAAAALKGELFDVMICDINLGTANGLSLVKAIRQNQNFTNRYMPIIMLTGDSRTETVEQALKLGVNRFLAKPLNPEGLLKAIVDVLEKPKAFVETKGYFGPDRNQQAEPPVTDNRIKAIGAGTAVRWD
jgi:two-component system, chemotaxis family, chemotaxis protein CheY